MPNLINYNGNFLDKEASIINSDNRLFQYGDGLFETIRLSNGKVMFLKDHFERLQRGAKYFKLQLPEYFSEDFFNKQILDTAESNDISLNGRVKVIVFRNGEGKYEPLTNEASWLIKASPLYRPDYQWSEEGLHLGIFDKAKKPVDEISNYKTTSSLLYVLAAVYKKESGFDESVILNTKGNIADTIYANLFFAKNEKIYTPALSEAPVDGVMRKQVLQLAKKLGYKVYEDVVSHTDLNNADEVFLTNAIKGILWVKQFENKPYTNEISKQLLNSLNDLIE